MISVQSINKLSELYGKTFSNFILKEKGYVNTGGYVTDGEGNEYFIKQYDPTKFTKEVIDIALYASNFFNQRGIPSCIPIKSVSNDDYVEINNTFYAIFNKIDGEQYTRKNAPIWTYKKLGELHAKMHKAGEEYIYESKEVERRKVNRKDKFMRIYNEILPLVKDKRILESLEIKKKFMDSAIEPTISTDGYVLEHGDLTIENVFWKDREIISVIDFDSAQYEHPYFHILRSLRIMFAIDGYGKEFEDRLRRFLKGYQSISKIDKEVLIQNMQRSRYKVISGTWIFREVVKNTDSNIKDLLEDEIRNTYEWANNYENLKERVLEIVDETR
jgi:Ser/Thr protein kinase RdoA (MazF antagonist)